MEEPRINMVTGIVGAFIGVLIGVALHVGIYQMGYIASISGIVMMVGAIKGFELLGKGLNIPAIIFCIVIVLAAVFFANKIAMAVEIMREWDYEFGTSYKYIDYLTEVNSEYASAYMHNLVMGYVFSLIGIIPSIRDFLRGKRAQSQNNDAGMM